MAEGAFRCSLYHSSKVLADSSIYSSSHLVLPHLNQYYDVTLLCLGCSVLWGTSAGSSVCSPFEMYLDTIFATDVLVAFT